MESLAKIRGNPVSQNREELALSAEEDFHSNNWILSPANEHTADWIREHSETAFLYYNGFYVSYQEVDQLIDTFEAAGGKVDFLA